MPDVALNTGSSTAAGQSATLTPGAVTVTLAAGSSTAAGQLLLLPIVLGTGSSSVTGQPLLIISVVLNAGASSAAGQLLTITPGPITVTLNVGASVAGGQVIGAISVPSLEITLGVGASTAAGWRLSVNGQYITVLNLGSSITSGKALAVAGGAPPALVEAATANELAYFRTNGQFSKLYLAFPQPAIVFKARVNGVSGGKDQVIFITYDTVTYGAYSDIIPDMTLLIGSAEGGHDLGIARIRKAATDVKLFIGETSELQLADDMYLTVIDEYGLWPRHKYVQSGSEHVDYMDFDVAYVDQHADLDPCPVLGPDRVLFYQGALGGANIISANFNAGLSFCLGSTVTGYSWTAPGSSGSSGMDTSTPTITWDAPGTYRITCTITAANGKTFTGRRVIIVYDDTAQPVKEFLLESCSGDLDSGGWSFQVTMYDNADLTLVRDRAQVILFARDWYGDITSLTDTGISFEASSHKILKTSGLSVFKKGAVINVSGSTSNNGQFTVTASTDAYLVVAETIVDEAAGDSVTIGVLYGQTEISIGPVAGCENVICSGWISKEDLTYDVDGGVAAFTAHGPAYWLGQMQGFISGLRFSATAPTEWNFLQNLTVDKGLWDMLHWRTTATVVIDCFLTGDTKLIPTMESTSVGSLWEQLAGQARETILADCFCDRYGRFVAQVNGQYIPQADRDFIVVMTVEAYDRIGEIELERQTVPPVGMVDLSGVWFDGTTGYALRALASGHIINRYGRPEIFDKLIMEDQAHCNELASLVLAERINPYPRMNFKLGSNMRLADILPRQQLFVVTESDMNPREVTVSNNVFPRRISFDYNTRIGSITVSIESAPETTYIPNSVPGEIPVTTEPPTDDWSSPIGYWPWYPPIVLTPPEVPAPPAEPADCPDSSPVSGPYSAGWDRSYITGDPEHPENKIARLWIKGAIRSAGATYPTRIEFAVRNPIGSDFYTHLHLYGIDSVGTRVATGSLHVVTYTDDGKIFFMEGNFSLASATTIAGFELEIDEGWEAPGPGFDMATLVASATADDDGAICCYVDGEIIAGLSTTILKTNQLMFTWSGRTRAGVCYGDACYQARVNASIHVHLDVGVTSRMWRYVQLVMSGGVSGIVGTDIPLGPDYGPGVGNYALYGPGETVKGPPYYSPGTYWKITYPEDLTNSISLIYKAGSAQTTLDNPSTRGEWLYCTGTLLLIASDAAPIPISVGLGPATIWNLCPVGMT